MRELAFRIGNIPVRVHPLFLLLALLLGEGMSGGEPARLLLCMAIIFVAILIHELGHALAGIAFGLKPHIDIHGMGGTTSWPAGRKLPWLRSIAVSFAGPGVGLAVAAITIAIFGMDSFYGVAAHAQGPIPPTGEFGRNVRDAVIDVNGGWGILNLLPMLPLDGGNIMTSLFDKVTRGRGARPARFVSIAVGVGIGAAILYFQQPIWNVLLCAMFVAQNVRALGQIQQVSDQDRLRADLDAAYAALDAKDSARVLAIAVPIAKRAKAPDVKAEALHLVAFGHLLAGRVEAADAAMKELPLGFRPHASFVKMRAMFTN